jgi:hypothetical protein
MNCQAMLQRAFVTCCLMGALVGLGPSISCELKRLGDCQNAWSETGRQIAAAAGLLTAAIAKFGRVGDSEP